MRHPWRQSGVSCFRVTTWLPQRAELSESDRLAPGLIWCCYWVTEITTFVSPGQGSGDGCSRPIPASTTKGVSAQWEADRRGPKSTASVFRPHAGIYFDRRTGLLCAANEGLESFNSRGIIDWRIIRLLRVVLRRNTGTSPCPNWRPCPNRWLLRQVIGAG